MNGGGDNCNILPNQYNNKCIGTRNLFENQLPNLGGVFTVFKI